MHTFDFFLARRVHLPRHDVTLKYLGLGSVKINLFARALVVYFKAVAGQLGEKDMLNACVWAMRARKFSAPHERELQSHLSRVLPQLQRMLSAEQLASCNQQPENWTPAALRNKDAQTTNPPNAAR
jgi:hypothetical protein